jgi:site-specific recombinase XerD
MRITQALSGYCLQLEADGRSRHTVAQARRHVRLLIQTTGDREVSTLRPEDLAAFLASTAVTKRADGGPRRPTSANALRSSLRCFFAFCHAAGHANMNPARLIRRARCAPPRPKGLSAGDVQKLLAALDTARSRPDLRDRALFRAMLGLGLRVGSVVALEVEDLDLEAAELRVRVMKNQDQDTVYLPDDLGALLRSYVGVRDKGPLFPRGDGGHLGARQIGRRLEIWADRAGIGRVSPHCLRHTFAMAAYERTGDVLVVGRLLCHRSIASTATYARPTEARVRAAMA